MQSIYNLTHFKNLYVQKHKSCLLMKTLKNAHRDTLKWNSQISGLYGEWIFLNNWVFEMPGDYCL